MRKKIWDESRGCDDWTCSAMQLNVISCEYFWSFDILGSFFQSSYERVLKHKIMHNDTKWLEQFIQLLSNSIDHFSASHVFCPFKCF